MIFAFDFTFSTSPMLANKRLSYAAITLSAGKSGKSRPIAGSYGMTVMIFFREIMRLGRVNRDWQLLRHD